MSSFGLGISYQGRIFKPDGSALEDSSVQFRIQIRSQGSENCLLYEELRTLNMSGSSGVFSVSINDGTGTRLDTPTYALESVFANRGTFTLDSTRCSTGTTFTPSASDGRTVIVYFKDSSMGSYEALPIMALNAIPVSLYALESQKVGPFGYDSILRTVDGSGNPVTAPALDPTQLTNLNALLAGTSTQYATSAQYTAIPTFAKTALPTCGAGEVLKGNGTALSCVTDSGGGSSTYSSISAATSTNTIDNTNFAQTWNWSTATTQSPLSLSANAITTGSLLNLTTSSASLNSTNGLIKVANTGASTSGILARFQSNATAGSGMTILNNGNVGVGTASPTAKLDILGAEPQLRVSPSAGQSSYIYLNKADNFTETGFQFHLANVLKWSVFSDNDYPNSGDAGDFKIVGAVTGEDDGSPRIRLPISNKNILLGLSGGSVGIGTASPSHRLHVPWKTGDSTSTAYFGGVGSDQTAILAEAKNGYIDAIIGSTDIGTGVRGEADNNGTGVYGYSFNGTAVSGGSFNGISGLFQSEYAGNTSATLVTKQLLTGTADLFQAQSAAGTSLVNITSAGNVGIGSTSPAFPLDLRASAGGSYGGASFSQPAVLVGGYYPYTAIQHSNGPDYSGVVNVITSGGDTVGGVHVGVAQKYSESAGDPNYYSIIGLRSNGNGYWDNAAPVVNGDHLPGIGFAGQTNTTPGSGMHIGAAILGRVDAAVSSNALPTALVFRTTQTNTTSMAERMRISSAGNVGIGTNNPSNALDVRANGSFDVMKIMNSSISGFSTAAFFDSSGTERLGIGFGNATSGFHSGKSHIYMPTGTDMVFANDTVAMLTLKSTAGYLGISNGAPGTLLHVGSATTGSGLAVANFQNADGTCTITPAGSGSGIACSSDERLKENFEDVDGNDALDRLLKLQAVTYNFKTASVDNRKTGYKAQEVRKIASEFVRQNDDGYLQIYYDAFIPWITEAIKVLHKNNQDAKQDTQEIKNRVQQLESENFKLKSENDAIKKYLCEKDPQSNLCRQ